MPLFEGIAVEVAGKITHKCLEVHEEDIKNAVDSMVKAAGDAYDAAWERDHDAGGISSWGEESETATA